MHSEENAVCLSVRGVAIIKKIMQDAVEYAVRTHTRWLDCESRHGIQKHPRTQPAEHTHTSAVQCSFAGPTDR
jgi:hypothetical protein